MSTRRSRRAVCASLIALGVPVAGCVDRLPDPTTPTPKAEPRGDTPTHQPFSNVLVENRDDAERVVCVRVGTDGETVHAARYRVPPATGLRISDVGERGWRYRLRAALAGGEWHELGWSPGCASDAVRGGAGSDGGVIVQDGSLEVVQNKCDFVQVGHRFETYADAGTHRVATLDADQDCR